MLSNYYGFFIQNKGLSSKAEWVPRAAPKSIVTVFG
jgi:hypothetical protein